MTTTTKPTTDPTAWMDEPIRAEKWKNLFFMKDGHSCFGGILHSSEADALAVYRNNFLKQLRTGAPIECVCGIIWDNDEHSHAIQIPVKS